MEAVTYKNLIIGDVEKSDGIWFATTSHPETYEVINSEVCTTKKEAKKAVISAWKNYTK